MKIASYNQALICSAHPRPDRVGGGGNQGVWKAATVSQPLIRAIIQDNFLPDSIGTDDRQRPSPLLPLSPRLAPPASRLGTRHTRRAWPWRFIRAAVHKETSFGRFTPVDSTAVVPRPVIQVVCSALFGLTLCKAIGRFSALLAVVSVGGLHSQFKWAGRREVFVL